MAKTSGTLDIRGNEYSYEWGKDTLSVFTRLGDKLTFRIQPEGLEKKYPKALAGDVVESAFINDIMGENLAFLRDDIFEVTGPTANRSTKRLFAYACN